MDNGVFLPILTHALYGYFNLIVIAEMCYQGLVISIGGLKNSLKRVSLSALLEYLEEVESKDPNTRTSRVYMLSAEC